MTKLINSFKNKKGFRRYIGPKRILILFLFFIFLMYVWNLHKSGSLSVVLVQNFISESGGYAIFIFIMISMLFSITFLPTLPFNVAAGFFWGFALGGLYTTIATTLAGIISFLFARYLMGQPLAGHFNNKWVNIVKDGFEKNDWKFLAFARINPIIPTGPLNYILGLTSVTSFTFIWTTFVFILPPSLMFSYFGEILYSLANDSSELKDIVYDVLTLSGIIVMAAILKFAIKIKQKIMELK